MDKMFENWVDLQKCFGEEIGINQQISLSNAVSSIGREFEGVQHSAIDDAENTAYIFQEMQTGNFKERYKELFDLFKPTEGLTVSIGSMFTNLMEQVECVGWGNKLQNSYADWTCKEFLQVQLEEKNEINMDVYMYVCDKCKQIEVCPSLEHRTCNKKLKVTKGEKPELILEKIKEKIIMNG